MKSNAGVEACTLFPSDVPRMGVVHAGTRIRGTFSVENFKTLINLTKSQSAFINQRAPALPKLFRHLSVIKHPSPHPRFSWSMF